MYIAGVISTMDVLVPIDGSDCSFRALRFATGFARRYDADLQVVHITDVRGEDTERIMDRAELILEDEAIRAESNVVIDLEVSKFRYADRVGKDILGIATEEEYDHVIMGYHGTGALGRTVVGSATDTVVKAADVPVTIIP